MTTVVLTGEGARGTYQAGVVHRLLSEGLKPDKYIGISSGALNACLFSQIDPIAVADTIYEIKSIKSLFSFNTFTFLFAKGLYNSSPLREKLRRLFKDARLHPKDRRTAIVADCNIKTGKIRYSNLLALPVDEIIDRTLSSLSISALVEPAIEGYIDGGAREINPLQYILENDPDDRIYCIFGRPIEINEIKEPTGLFKFAKVGLRSLDITMHAMQVDDLDFARRLKERGLYNGTILVYEPHKLLYDALDFDLAVSGYEAGLNANYKVQTI